MSKTEVFLAEWFTPEFGSFEIIYRMRYLDYVSVVGNLIFSLVVYSLGLGSASLVFSKETLFNKSVRLWQCEDLTTA